MKLRSHAVTLAALAAAVHASPSWGQQSSSVSVGRGWPVPVMEAAYVGGGLEGEGEQAAWEGAAPEGVTPLERDLFTTKDFYQDAALWSDPRYFRCNSPSTLQAMWGADLASALPTLGDCECVSKSGEVTDLIDAVRRTAQRHAAGTGH